MTGKRFLGYFLGRLNIYSELFIFSVIYMLLHDIVVELELNYSLQPSELTHLLYMTVSHRRNRTLEWGWGAIEI